MCYLFKIAPLKSKNEWDNISILFFINKLSGLHTPPHNIFKPGRFSPVPIYEYEAPNPGKACEKCLSGFEIIQGVNDPPLTRCPQCGHKVRKVMSWCRAAVIETPQEHTRIEGQITDYERQRMWSHAAELADKHSEKTKDRQLKTRALENYQKAGYDAASLEKHVKSEKD